MDRILPNIGNRYFLSSEEANNGEKFYQNAEGSTNLAFIPNEIFEKIGIKPIPFKLTETMGWHVYDHHAKEAKLKDISDAIDFVLSVINNVDHVRLGRDNSYIFSVENGRSRVGKRAVTIMVSSETGEFMGIRTSGYETLSKLKERPLLWERSANTIPEDAASSTITTIESQQGDETSSRAKSQSNVPSASEDTTSEEEIQESAQENADKAQEIDSASTAAQAEEQDKEERKQMLENMSIEELEKEIERIRNFNHPIFTMTEEEKAKEIAELQSIIDRKTQTSAQQPTAEEATPQAEE
jgi:hypothetical protein